MRVEDVQISSSRLMVPKSRKGRGKVSGYVRMLVRQDVLAAIRPVLAGRDPGEILLERWYHKRVGWNRFERDFRSPWKAATVLTYPWNQIAVAAGLARRSALQPSA